MAVALFVDAPPDAIFASATVGENSTLVLDNCDGVRITTMDKNKQARVEALGFKVGTAQEFLGLTDEENEIVEMHLCLEYSLDRQQSKRKSETTSPQS